MLSESLGNDPNLKSFICILETRIIHTYGSPPRSQWYYNRDYDKLLRDEALQFLGIKQIPVRPIKELSYGGRVLCINLVHLTPWLLFVSRSASADLIIIRYYSLVCLTPFIARGVVFPCSDKITDTEPISILQTT